MDENEKGKNKFVIIVVVALAALGIFLYIKSQTGLKSVDNTSEKTETSKSVPNETETSQSTTTPSDTVVQKVEVKEFAFNPVTITVKVGTKVTWTNKDSVAHTATSDDGSTFDTGLLNQGESGSFTFDKVGTYGYHCTPHPNMKASIIVVE